MKQTEREKLLEQSNELARIVSSIFDCQDIWLSDLGKLETMVYNLRRMIDAKPHKDKGQFNYVLSEDPNAYHWEKEQSARISYCRLMAAYSRRIHNE